MRNLALAALALAATVLTGVILVEVRNAAPDTRRPTPGLPDRLSSSDGASASGPDRTADQVALILARPLFEPSRRPEAGPASAEIPASGLPRVAGVLVSPAGKRVIFAAVEGGKPTTAIEGTRVGRYQVQSILAGQVTVIGPNGPQILRPSFDHGPTPAPGAAIPARSAVPPPPRLSVPPPRLPPDAMPANPDTITLPLRSPS